MNNISPYWYKLISHWTQLGQDGLTIPFILGAKKFIKPEKDYGKNLVQELFDEILNTDLGDQVIRFYECARIKEKVLGLLNKTSSKNYYGKIFLNSKTHEISLLIGNEVSKLGKDLNEISLKVYEEYKYYIENDLFSKRNGEWHSFSMKDIEMIETALSIN